MDDENFEKMMSEQNKDEEEDEKSPISATQKKTVCWSNGDLKSFERKRDELQEFLLKFDKMATFKIYFPQNNFINVIKKLKTKNSFAE